MIDEKVNLNNSEEEVNDYVYIKYKTSAVGLKLKPVKEIYDMARKRMLEDSPELKEKYPCCEFEDYRIEITHETFHTAEIYAAFRVVNTKVETYNNEQAYLNLNPDE